MKTYHIVFFCHDGRIRNVKIKTTSDVQASKWACEEMIKSGLFHSFDIRNLD